MPYFLTTAARTDVKSCTEQKPWAWMSEDGKRIFSLHRRRDLVKGVAAQTIVITAAEARQIRKARDGASHVMVCVRFNDRVVRRKVKRDRIGAHPVARIVVGEQRYHAASDVWHPYLDIRFFASDAEARACKIWAVDPQAEGFYRNLDDSIRDAFIREV